MVSGTILRAHTVTAFQFGRTILSLTEKLLSTDAWPCDYIRVIFIICQES